MAIKLQEAGIRQVTIFEKKDKIGGTWRENTYPGVACDVPAHMYTYSFEPNPEWSNRFAYGHEIFDYFQRVSDKYGITNTINYNEEVTESVYDNGCWHLQTSKGQMLTVDFVFNCTGILHKPAFPDIKGINSFKGDMFHTAQWDHSVELKGKRIGIIGTGSTATQVIPRLINTEGTEVSVFQRTPQWIIPFPQKDYSDKDKQRVRNNPMLAPLLHKFYSKGFRELFSKLVTGSKAQQAMISRLAKWNLKRSIKDKTLRQKLTPEYQVGCKRLIINNDFYPAIQKDNAHLVTESIDQITAKGIQTKDGKLHELDILVLSTGFDPFAFMRPMNLIGRDGLDINQVWQNKAVSYKSILLPGFPNFFLMLGPNTPIGNNSVISMSETQADYAMQLIEDWRHQQFDAVEPTEEAVKAFMAYIKKGMPNTVWVTGCNSWYLDADGDAASWPYSWEQWITDMKTPDYADLQQHRVKPEPAISAA
ncbi:MAG: NAD(P)/FAD-dependent oxidoreductase [Candidatus Pelagadaptatus aseana]